ncbi:MAG: hypothetical protein VX899_09745 [Myxococcota bacterium]|nr:hypothetical protein [Myxococcota bacterium]
MRTPSLSLAKAFTVAAFGVAFFGAAAASGRAAAMECVQIDSWTGTGIGAVPTVSSVACDVTPSGYAWFTQVQTDFATPPDELHVLIDLSDSQVSGMTFQYYLYYTGHSGGLPEFEVNGLVCVGCPNETELTLDPPLPCGESMVYDGATIQPWYDNANCYIDAVPAGEEGFVWANNYYLFPQEVCLMGSYDGANCLVASVPKGSKGFIWRGGLYTTTNVAGACPYGVFDGANCYLGAIPEGTTGFLQDGNLYITTSPYCAYGSYDGANCYMGTPPAGTTAFIYPSSTGNFYHTP